MDSLASVRRDPVLDLSHSDIIDCDHELRFEIFEAKSNKKKHHRIRCSAVNTTDVFQHSNNLRTQSRHSAPTSRSSKQHLSHKPMTLNRDERSLHAERVYQKISENAE